MRRALGKGLSQLIGEQQEGNITNLPLSQIAPNPKQPRTVFEPEALNELAESIKEHGLIQPLLVRPVAEGTYELIAGERRWRASQIAGLTQVPVVIRAAGDKQTLELALIENLQREDISSIEAARAYRRLTDEFDLSQEAVAVRVGKSRTAITNTMRLLRLPKRVQSALETGEVTEGQVRPLCSLDSEAEQLAVFEQIQTYGLSAREIEKRLKKSSKDGGKKPRRKSVIGPEDPNWRRLAEAASEKLGAPVQLNGSEKGGMIQIAFYSEEDLVRIMDALGVEL
jgi:ParB family transcriptional regulator, chromosome partitioning protein